MAQRKKELDQLSVDKIYNEYLETLFHHLSNACLAPPQEAL